MNGHTFKNELYDPNLKGRNATHDLSRSLKVTGYPTLVFFNEKLEILQKEAGYKTPQQLEIFLKYYGSGAYKTTPGQEFQANFKPEIK